MPALVPWAPWQEIWLFLESAISSRSEHKSCLGQVFNFKFDNLLHGNITAQYAAILPRFNPVSEVGPCSFYLLLSVTQGAKASTARLSPLALHQHIKLSQSCKQPFKLWYDYKRNAKYETSIWNFQHFISIQAIIFVLLQQDRSSSIGCPCDIIPG